MPRSITMKSFRTGAAIELASGRPSADGTRREGGETVVLGKVFGQVNKIEMRMGTLPNGDEKPSLALLGDFEAYSQQNPSKAITANVFYPPAYYAEAIKVDLDKRGPGARVLFSCEILMMPSGKSVPYMYDVRNLIRRDESSGVAIIKQLMKDKGMINPDPKDEEGMIDHVELPPVPQIEAPVRQVAYTAKHIDGSDTTHSEAATGPDHAALGELSPGAADEEIDLETGEVVSPADRAAAEDRETKAVATRAASREARKSPRPSGKVVRA